MIGVAIRIHLAGIVGLNGVVEVFDDRSAFIIRRETLGKPTKHTPCIVVVFAIFVPVIEGA